MDVSRFSYSAARRWGGCWIPAQPDVAPSGSEAVRGLDFFV
jgi:hypothetical protein